MTEHFPVWIVLIPLFGALLCGLIGMRWPRVCPLIALVGMGMAAAVAAGILQRVAEVGEWSYFVGNWVKPRGIGIELRVDGINALVLTAVAVVGLLVAVFSPGRLGRDEESKPTQYYILFLLLMTGLFGVTVTGDAFNLYVMIEIIALTGYALLAMGPHPRARLATFNYLIMGTIGASFYLLGVGYLYLHTGMLNMAGIHGVLAAGPANSVALVAFTLIMVGLWLKMALFPLGGWLPNVYTYGPPLAAAAAAPLVTKVTVYVMVRMMVTVFGWKWVFGGGGWNQAVVWLAVVAILAGALMALAAKDLKRMLCCLILSEVGYMVGGAWLANRWGMTGAIYHILGDAFMTLTLFLAAGVLAGRAAIFKLEQFEGMFRRRPWVMAAFTVGALGMIGLPPTCGFFSKWFLIRGGLEAGHYGYVGALIVSSLINAVLFFRIFEIAVFGSKPGSHGYAGPQVVVEPDGVKAKGTDLLALYGAAAMVVVVGLGSGWISGVIQRALEVNGVPLAAPAVLAPAVDETPTNDH